MECLLDLTITISKVDLLEVPERWFNTLANRLFVVWKAGLNSDSIGGVDTRESLVERIYIW